MRLNSVRNLFIRNSEKNEILIEKMSNLLSLLKISFCSKMAQHMGVAKVRMMPRRPIWRGAAAQGTRFSVPFFSTAFITRGISTMPGKIFMRHIVLITIPNSF